MIERFKIADVNYFYFDMLKNHEINMIIFLIERLFIKRYTFSQIVLKIMLRR